MKENADIIPGVDCAMYDNASEQRREFWRSKQLAVVIAQDAVEDDIEFIERFITKRKFPKAAIRPWQANQVVGDVNHLPEGWSDGK